MLRSKECWVGGKISTVGSGQLNSLVHLGNTPPRGLSPPAALWICRIVGRGHSGDQSSLLIRWESALSFIWEPDTSSCQKVSVSEKWQGQRGASYKDSKVCVCIGAHACVCMCVLLSTCGIFEGNIQPQGYGLKSMLLANFCYLVNSTSPDNIILWSHCGLCGPPWADM